MAVILNQISQNLSNAPSGAFGDLVSQIGGIALWLQAAGIILIVWIILESFMAYLNFKRLKEVYNIKEDMRRIESKIDSLMKKSRK